MTVTAIFPSPKTIAKSLGSGRQWHTSKPDTDNIVKCVGDALVQSGILRDDSIVARIEAGKWVARDGEAPSVRVQVEALRPSPVIEWPKPPRKMTKTLAATCVRRFRAGDSFASIAYGESIEQEAVEDAVRRAPPPRAKKPPKTIHEQQAGRDLTLRFTGPTG